MGYSEGRALKEIYSYKCTHQKRKKISNQNLNLHLEELEKEEQNKLKTRREKKKINIRAETNKKENFLNGNSVKPKVCSFK